jgi:hypothetical protein
MEVKLPLINEEVALLLRYEIEIDPKVGFFRDIQFEFLGLLKVLEQHQSLSRLWENYKYFLDESLISFKRLKVKLNFEFFALILFLSFRNR